MSSGQAFRRSRAKFWAARGERGGSAAVELVIVVPATMMMLALAVTVFPLNTHLAFYSTFWGGLTLLLAALYAGSLLAREDE